MKKHYDIFLSYSRQDITTIQYFANELKKRNLSFFYDTENILAGEDFANIITSAISQAKLFVLFISEKSMQSRWVINEVECAFQKGIKIFPIHLDNTTIPDVLTFQLSGIQIFKFDQNKPVDSIAHIARTIESLVKREILATETPVGALPKAMEPTGAIIGGAVAAMGGPVGAVAGGTILGYFKRKYSLKLFCDAEIESDMEVKVDGQCIAKIKHQDVIELKFIKGKYFINICPTNKNLKTISFTHSFSKENNGEIKEIILPLKNQNSSKNNNLVRYKCFIGGSTLLDAERNAVRATLSRLHNEWENESLIVSSYTFEDFSNAQNQQQRYFDFIRQDATCAIFIIANGVGDKTIAEYQLAYETFTESGIRPMIFVYADETVSNLEVDKFRRKVLNNGSYWRKYKDIETLMFKVREDINAELFAIFKIGLKK